MFNGITTINTNKPASNSKKALVNIVAIINAQIITANNKTTINFRKTHANVIVNINGSNTRKVRIN